MALCALRRAGVTGTLRRLHCRSHPGTHPLVSALPPTHKRLLHLLSWLSQDVALSLITVADMATVVVIVRDSLAVS
jgi:hypothetical protein